MKATRLSPINIAATVFALLLCSVLHSQCAVDAGPDTTFCQQQGQLLATPAVASPNYVFIWSPATGLSDPYAQNPYVVSGVSNQQYIVQMNDSFAGCYTSDTVIVSAYYFSIDTITVCYLDSILLDFGPGATFYNWQFFTDTNNVTTSINANTQTYWASNPGRYTGFANFPGCGSLTSVITIVDSCFSTCQVDAGPPVTHFCDQLVQLNATAISPGNDYTYSWSPANLLVNPNTASVTATGPMNLSNQQFIVTMTDTVSGCVATDSIRVYSYTNTDTTFTLCVGDTVLVSMPSGATFYEWHTYIDTAGNVYPFSFQYSYLYIGSPGIILGSADFPCGTMTTTIIATWCSSSCNVSAGPDTTFCQQQGQLFAVYPSPGNYSFSWSPATGLDNPYAQNPHVMNGVNNQQYVVTLTDLASSCVATDTVVVSAHYMTVDTLYICQGQPLTYDLGPGATQYSFMFTDTSGNLQSGSFAGSTFVITQPAQYGFNATYPGCGIMYSQITVIDSCNVYVPNVWPGDCNYDLIVDASDVLQIGLANNATGALRPNASNAWYPQAMADWPQNYANCNYKHGDADGNGVIDMNDTLPVSLNYSLTHPFRYTQPQVPATSPTLQLVAQFDTVGLQTWVRVDVVLGSVSTPMDSLYGISFRITSEAALIDTNQTVINANNSWLGTTGGDMFTFQKHFRSNAMIDFAEVKNNHINTVNGNGVIASFFIVTTDNLSGIEVCDFNLSDVTCVTESQTYITLNLVNDSVVINPSLPIGIVPVEETVSFTMYPNPAKESVTIHTTGSTGLIEICDMSGRVVRTIAPNSNVTVIETSSLANGVYLVNVKSGASVVTQKLTISR